MIFPGMDPYLEDPLVWPDVHARFIVYLSEHLYPLLRPRYVVAVESRVFVEGPGTAHPIIPDAEVRPTRSTLPLATVALPLYTAYRLSVAYRLYLRFDHPRATAASAQLIVWLAVPTEPTGGGVSPSAYVTQ